MAVQGPHRKHTPHKQTDRARKGDRGARVTTIQGRDHPGAPPPLCNPQRASRTSLGRGGGDCWTTKRPAYPTPKQGQEERKRPEDSCDESDDSSNLSSSSSSSSDSDNSKE